LLTELALTTIPLPFRTVSTVTMPVLVAKLAYLATARSVLLLPVPPVLIPTVLIALVLLALALNVSQVTVLLALLALSAVPVAPIALPLTLVLHVVKDTTLLPVPKSVLPVSPTVLPALPLPLPSVTVARMVTD